MDTVGYINNIDELRTVSLDQFDPDPTFRNNLVQLKNFIPGFMAVNRDNIDEEMERTHFVKRSQLAAFTVRARAQADVAAMEVRNREGAHYIEKKNQLTPKLSDDAIKALLHTDEIWRNLVRRKIDLEEQAKYLEMQCDGIGERHSMIVNLSKRMSFAEGRST